MADVTTLYWRDLLPKGLNLVISLGPRYELADLQVIEADDESHQSDQLLYEETSFAGELHRAVARSFAGRSASIDVVGTRDRLQRLKDVWQRSRRGAPLIRPKLTSLRSPTISASSSLRLKMFVDRVGSHTAEVSWVLLGSGPDGEEVKSYELEILQHRTSTTSYNRIKLRSRSSTRDNAQDGLESLGSFQVGGETSRTFVARRLEPLRWYRLRIRAIGTRRSWISPWSEEVPFKTISIEDAKAAGIYVSPEKFLVASERQIQAIAALRDPLDDEMEDMPGYAFAKDVLDARYTKSGWTDFVRLGSRYSRPAATREQRLRRMKLVLAAQECYSQDLLDGNHWSMGPFYYERVGLKQMKRAGMCSA
jgi:hypothetical protein